MTPTISEPSVERIVSFFERLAELGPVLTRVAGTPMEMVIEIRGTGVRILLDMRATPMRVRVGGADIAGDIQMAASPEDLHRVLSGELWVVDGIMERTLLLSGGMSYLVRGFRVLQLAPLLYLDHIHRPARRGLRTRAVEPQAAAVAHGIGRVLRARPELELVEALDALAGGVLAHAPDAHPRARPRRTPPPGHALEWPAPTEAELRRRGRTRRAMAAAGRMVGLTKYRAGADVDLFRIVRHLGDGMREAEAHRP